MVAKGRHARGDTHMSRTKPWTLARGDRNGARLHPETVKRGEGVNTARLTATQVRMIRVLHDAGFSQWAIAQVFGVTHVNVGDIVHRNTWQHVE
jgi:hypothetical protein